MDYVTPMDILRSIAKRAGKRSILTLSTVDLAEIHACVDREERAASEAAKAKQAPEHDWYSYANGCFCRRCGAFPGSGYPCR